VPESVGQFLNRQPGAVGLDGHAVIRFYQIHFAAAFARQAAGSRGAPEKRVPTLA
jgi:hypothetical protein